MIQISTDMWVTLANPIKAVSDTIREVWVCENGVLSQVYPVGTPSSDVYWYLLPNATRSNYYDFHLCAGQSHVPAAAVSSGKVEYWSAWTNRPYHNQRNIILSVVIDEPVAVPSGRHLFSGFTVAGTWTNLSNLSLGSQCVDTNRMFGNCQAMTGTLDISGWNMSNVTEYEGMFLNCYVLTTLVLPSGFGAGCSNLSYVFSGLRAVTSINTEVINTASATTLRNMFNGCWRMVTIDVSSFDTSNVTDMRSMFYNCSDVTTILATSSFVTTNVSTSQSMFYQCTNLVGGQNTPWDSSHTDSAYAHIDGGQSNPGYFTQK